MTGSISMPAAAKALGPAEAFYQWLKTAIAQSSARGQRHLTGSGTLDRPSSLEVYLEVLDDVLVLRGARHRAARFLQPRSRASTMGFGLIIGGLQKENSAGKRGRKWAECPAALTRRAEALAARAPSSDGDLLARS